ncbi:MAG: choice-of-anchor Q domain-containing protein, partial [Saprospiraceae bacterium]|nr:choice-of-anchor Q domain-containing protein [Saprospiraceae bacterium]
MLLFIALPLSAQRLYVRASATGNNSGQSWTNAFIDLQSALQIAQKGDSVWVAEGLYRPTNTIDRAVSFEPRSGVVVIGGFAGTETSPIERDWTAHPTVLTGDIGIIGDSTDNSYNVMYLLEPDSTTVLDGLILRDGVADNEALANDTYSRLLCGGGLYIMGASADAYPNIFNCVFEHNTALYFGGGMIVNGNNNGSTAPKLVHCRFEGNRAGKNGGGIAKYGASEVERGLDFNNCQFIANQAARFGGGIYYLDGEGRDKIGLESCLFLKNSTERKGGGAFFSLGRQSYSSFICKNSIFNQNNSFEGAAIDMFTNFNEFDGDLTFDSCQFFKNLNTSNFQGEISSVAYIDLFFTSQSKVIISKNLFSQNNIPRIVGINSSDQGACYIENSLFLNNKISQSPISSSILFISDFDESKTKNLRFTNNNRQIIKLTGIKNAVVSDVLSVNFDTIFTIMEFSSITTPIIKNCTVLNKTIESVSNSGSQILNIQNSYFQKTNMKSFNNLGTTYLSNNYLGGFDCAAQPPNVICLDGNITSGDPMFADTAQGNYTPLPCSPLVHAGSNAFVGLEDSVDLAGNPRIRGGRVDIGAFEAPAPELAAPPTAVGACPGSASGAVTFDLTQACLPYQAQWSKNGVSGSGTTQLESGTYSFTL